MFWRNLFHRDQADQEWRDEMESHLEMLASSFEEQGLTAEEARAAARKQAGNLTLRREEIYRMNGIGWLDSLAGDIRYALRGLRRDASFTAVAALTLALGIGANTAVFSVVNRVLLQPLPYAHPEELVDVAQVAPGAGAFISGRGLALSQSMYFTYSEQNRSFQSMGVWTSGNVTVTGLADPEQVTANIVSDGLLDSLAVPPAIGRVFHTADQTPGANATVLLTYGYWQRRFGGDPSVIGRTLTVDSRSREIIGVMPAGFRIADTPAELILPLRPDRVHATLPGFYLSSIARLKPGVSIDQATADIARLIPIWRRSWPLIDQGKANDATAESVYQSWRIAPNLRPLRDSVVGNVRSVLWVVMGTLAIVMIIASANVACLLLVRTDGRQPELAVRAALGAGWTRIVRQLLVESLLLSTIGGVLGIAIAYGGLQLLVRNGPSNLPRITEIGLDGNALIFALLVVLLSGLFFGLIPALRYGGPGVSLRLREGARTISASRERHRARNALVVVQVSLALVLLISSGLMIRTFQSMRSVPAGFRAPGQLQTFRVVVPDALAASGIAITRMEQAIADKVAAIPGVTAVSFASTVPMDGSIPDWDGIFKEGQSYSDKSPPPMRYFVNVAPGFFGAMGTRFKAGRDLTWTEVYNSERGVVLLSENLARELFGSAEAAVGKRVRGSDSDIWREVVGVVEDIRHAGAQEPAPAVVYWPVLRRLQYAPVTSGNRFVTFAVRTDRAGTGPLLSEIRTAVWSVNAALPVANPDTMREIADRSMARTAFTLVMLAIAGSMALLLGLIGIYGTISYAVSQRTREIGIRLALGAAPADVSRMFVGYGLRLSAVGIAIGVSAAAVLTRAMKSLLFGVAPTDPATFVAVPAILLVATLVACYLPARRVTTLDPTGCMKAE